jgi:hypothetical protein
MRALAGSYDGLICGFSSAVRMSNVGCGFFLFFVGKVTSMGPPGPGFVFSREVIFVVVAENFRVSPVAWLFLAGRPISLDRRRIAWFAWGGLGLLWTLLVSATC